MQIINDVFAFDLECVAKEETYLDLDEKWHEPWRERCHMRYENYYEFDPDNPEEFYAKCWKKFGGLLPEYSRLLCISISICHIKKGEKMISSTVLSGDEKEIIQKFFKLTQKFMDEKGYAFMAGHNVKGFDIPYICKKAMLNGIQYFEFPHWYKIADKKPWNLDYILDTKEMWKCGSWKMMEVTLEETCLALGIDSPKDGEVKGSEIFDFIYKDNGDLDKIYKYCKRDTEAVLRILEKAF